jgi:hypothetical protein
MKTKTRPFQTPLSERRAASLLLTIGLIAAFWNSAVPCATADTRGLPFLSDIIKPDPTILEMLLPAGSTRRVRVDSLDLRISSPEEGIVRYEGSQEVSVDCYNGIKIQTTQTAVTAERERFSRTNKVRIKPLPELKPEPASIEMTLSAEAARDIAVEASQKFDVSKITEQPFQAKGRLSLKLHRSITIQIYQASVTIQRDRITQEIKIGIKPLPPPPRKTSGS